MGELAFIGFGANLGDRERTFEAAVKELKELPGTTVTRVSHLYETEPVDISDEGPPFMNAVVAVETRLTPRELATGMREIELKLGKSPVHRSDLSRVIDLDLLLYGDLVLKEESLVIPHPRMSLRAFVLAPMAEIAPEALHPELGKTVEELLQGLKD